MTSDGDELDFHLRELQADVEGARREIGALGDLGAPDVADRAHKALVGIAALLEHDHGHHAAEAQALAPGAAAVRQAAGGEAASEKRWAAVDAPPGDRLPGAAELAGGLRGALLGLSARLEHASAAVDQIDALRRERAAPPPEVARRIEGLGDLVEDAGARAFAALRFAKLLSRAAGAPAPAPRAKPKPKAKRSAPKRRPPANKKKR